MALSEQQLNIIKERQAKKQGLSPAINPSREEAIRLLDMEQSQNQVKTQQMGFFGRAKEALTERAKQFGETFKKAASGEISPIETGVRFVGDVAGGIGDIIGAAVEPAVRPILESDIARPAVEKLAQGMDVYDQWKQESPTNERVGKMLESVVNIADIAVGAKGTGKVLKAGEKVAEEALVAGKRGAKDVIEGVVETGKKVAQSKVGKDLVPTKKGIISGQITKALDLTTGDTSNIKLSTGNDVGEWIAKNNLIGGNKEETISNIKNFVDSQYKAVRDEVKKVPTVYKKQSVPRVEESLRMLKNEVTDVLGQEKVLDTVNTLLKKKSYTLSDIQKTKELLDKQFDLYKATGDVKAGQTKTGLANVRKELKQFIEKEVEDTTGAKIADLNNNVATGQNIKKLAEKRSTRGFTRANVSLSDLGFFGAGSILATPLGGAAALLAKRIVETPAMRLKFAKWVNSLDKSVLENIKKELLQGKIPKNIPEEIKNLGNE